MLIILVSHTSIGAVSLDIMERKSYNDIGVTRNKYYGKKIIS